MKYRCKTCNTTCTDIMDHVRKVHKFSDWIIEENTKTNKNSFKSAFEEIK